MARRRFFVGEVRSGRAELTGEPAEHLRRVLRAERGQRYELSDNRSVYLAEIEAFGKGKVSFRVVEELEAEGPPVRLTLLASLIKFDRFEWIIEKATELGVERIVPVEAERSGKGLAQAAAKRIGRWRKIVLESSQQARRSRLAELDAPVAFKRALEIAPARRYFLEEQRDAPAILAALPDAARRHASDAVALLVGPEGGWTDAEREAAASRGWQPVSLGPQILRAETAAVAAVAVLSSAWCVRMVAVIRD